jgi:hypothetical protein
VKRASVRAASASAMRCWTSTGMGLVPASFTAAGPAEERAVASMQVTGSRGSKFA